MALRGFAYAGLKLVLGVGCAVLAFEYSGCVLQYWGVGYYTSIDIFYRSGGAGNLGLLYVVDAALWWGAAVVLVAEGIRGVRGGSLGVLR